MKFNKVDINAKSIDLEQFVSDFENGSTSSHHLYLAIHNQRKKGQLVNASVKTRGMVRGGGAKPFNQKGTGRARCGTSRSPLKVGGGVIFGPSPRIRRHKISSKILKMSLFSSLASKDDKLFVLDSPSSDLKTKDISAFLSNLKVADSQRVLFVLDSSNESVLRASRNIKNVTILSVMSIQLSNVLSSDVVVFTKESFVKFKEGGRS